MADDDEVAESGAETASGVEAPLVIGEAVPQRVPRRTIAIDGTFEDWSNLSPVARGHSTHQAEPFIRLGRVWATYDDHWVYFRIELGRAVNVQGLTGTLSLQLDADGNRLSGDIRPGGKGEVGMAGVDFEFRFSPRNSQGGFGGVGAEVVESGLPTAPANPYWFGASFAPTFASDEIELRLARGDLIPGATVTPFAGSGFSARLTFMDEAGSIVDRTPPFSVAITAPPRLQIETAPTEVVADATGMAPAMDAPAVPTEEADPVEPPGESSEAGSDPAPDTSPSSGPDVASDGDPASPPASPVAAPPSGRLARLDHRDSRAMTWNVRDGSIFANPEPFVRIMRAIDPDIICFQELGDAANGSLLRSWLDEHVPTTFGWEVQVTARKGVGVASRLSAVPVTSISGFDGPGAPQLRAASLLVAAADRRVLVTSVHLKCCGRAGDASDQQRVQEAGAIRRLLRAAQFDLRPSGLLVMGDFNLVGSHEPMDIVKFQNDLNATDLLNVEASVRGDATNTTWRDPELPFLPARLDYAVISDAVLQVTQAFVLDTELLDAKELTELGLVREDSGASDHLPVIIDFR